VEPTKKMQVMWDECLGRWEKINERMREIQFLEFGSLEEFWNIGDIVRQHVYRDHKLNHMSSK
jgi:hypothetical protein